MVLKNAKVFVDGKFAVLDIAVEDGKITAVQENLASSGEAIDCYGKMIWPGLFDIHTHGCLGFDFSKSNPEEMAKMCEFYAKHGVTSILATTMTNEDHQYSRAMGYIKQAMDAQKLGKSDKKSPFLKQATIRGINMEGPFFGKEKKGAHDEQYLRPVSQKLTDEYQKLSGDAIRLLDIDPDLDGAIDFISKNKDKMTISIAHTNCNYETAKEAAKAGATHVTHLFNAMRPMLHREPGLVGAAFELGLDAEIICDGIHIHPAVIHLMFSAMPERMILISDSINPTGMPDGGYEAGGLQIQVKNHRAYLADGTLAGSTITLFDAVKHAVEFGVPLEHALNSAASIPARSVGLDNEAGTIACGREADLLIVNEELELERVMIHGSFLSD